jgi:hypothetical protein
LFLEEVRVLDLTTEILHALLFPSLRKNLDDFIHTFFFPKDLNQLAPVHWISLKKCDLASKIS